MCWIEESVLPKYQRTRIKCCRRVRKVGTQTTIRENIEALSKTPEAKTLIARYIAKANDQETRLEMMEKERKSLEAEKERLERELITKIKNFEVQPNAE